ncbi:MAG TPA: SRPBCC family protein [Blastocatellia bacterium]|nr:SRPBCC family protein [Blastocatellia bacterium]
MDFIEMPIYTLERKQEILRPRSEVFEFFSEPFNLERITPAFLRFSILNKPPVVLCAGSRLEYRLALFGVRFQWKTLIEEWKPEESFVDVQLSGPYKLWRHTHTFRELSSDRTLMIDRVEYGLPGGAFAKPAHALFVAPMLRRIFDHRARTIEQLLNSARRPIDSITSTHSVAS